MMGTKAFAAPSGMFARGGKAREWDESEGGSARVGYSSVVSFRRLGRASAPIAPITSKELAETDDGGKGLFVAHASGLAPRDPVAHPKWKPRLKGAAKPIFLCEEPSAKAILEPKELISKTEVDMATFVEAVTAAYPQPRDPDVRPVLQARPKGAALPSFVFLPGEPGTPKAAERPAWDAEAMQRAHKERELKAFHEFLDRMESGPLEALDRPLADLDEKAEASRKFTAPPALHPALYDPILEEDSSVAAVSPAHEAPPVPEEDRPLIVKAVIEPLEPVGNPRLPQTAEVLPGGVPQRLSPSQRAHLKRPVTLRDRDGRIAPVTYSMNPR